MITYMSGSGVFCRKCNARCIYVSGTGHVHENTWIGLCANESETIVRGFRCEGCGSTDFSERELQEGCHVVWTNPEENYGDEITQCGPIRPVQQLLDALAMFGVKCEPSKSRTTVTYF